MHLTETDLATLAHRALAGPTPAPDEVHLAACAECQARLRDLRTADTDVAALLQSLDHVAPRVRVEHVVARAGRGPRRLVRPIAAALALAVAGAAAALPSSPVRRLVERAIVGARATRMDVPNVERASVPASVPEVAPSRRGAGIAVVPGDRVEVRFRGVPDDGRLRVRFVDAEQASLVPEDGDAGFSIARGEIVVAGASARRFTLAIPRAVIHVRVRVDSLVVFRRDGARTVSDAFADGAGEYLIRLDRSGQPR